MVIYDISTIRCKSYVTLFKKPKNFNVPPSPPKQCWLTSKWNQIILLIVVQYAKLNIVLGGRGVLWILWRYEAKMFVFSTFFMCNIPFCNGLSVLGQLTSMGHEEKHWNAMVYSYFVLPYAMVVYWSLCIWRKKCESWRHSVTSSKIAIGLKTHIIHH